MIGSGLFWLSSAVAAGIDAVFIWILVRIIKPERFRTMKWTLVGTTAVFWSVFAVVLVAVFWDSYYRYIFPGWFHSGGILIFVPLVYAGFAWAFHWLSLRLPGHPLLSFCLLAGVESLLEHLWGIFGMRVMEIPILQGVSTASVLSFCFPEYIFYWCIIISLAILVDSGIQWRKNRLRTG